MILMKVLMAVMCIFTDGPNLAILLPLLLTLQKVLQASRIGRYPVQRHKFPEGRKSVRKSFALKSVALEFQVFMWFMWVLCFWSSRRSVSSQNRRVSQDLGSCSSWQNMLLFQGVYEIVEICTTVNAGYSSVWRRIRDWTIFFTHSKCYSLSPWLFSRGEGS